MATQPQKDYELLDSGDGKKLERYGQFVLSRPDPQVLWAPQVPAAVWKKADATFVREGKNVKWKTDKALPKAWPISFGGLTMEIRPTTFKHTGLFPEHEGNWRWMSDQIKKAKQSVKVLNLFGYTGGASLACAKAGAEVTHVDGSKTAIEWGRKNQELSGLNEAKIRWILDDAIAFLRREAKRGNTYDGIVMDPPAFGHGPKGELWKIEEQFVLLMDSCYSVLSENPIFFLINGYASGYSPLSYKNAMLRLPEKFGGGLETGELLIKESHTERVLPCGIFARWGR